MNWVVFVVWLTDRPAFNFISREDHCQRSSSSQIYGTRRAGFESVSSGLIEWTCAVAITTTPWRHIKHKNRCSLVAIFLLKFVNRVWTSSKNRNNKKDNWFGILPRFEIPVPLPFAYYLSIIPLQMQIWKSADTFVFTYPL